MDVAGGVPEATAQRARASLRAYAAGLGGGAGRLGQPADPASRALWPSAADDLRAVEGAGAPGERVLALLRSTADQLGLLEQAGTADGAAARGAPDGGAASDGAGRARAGLAADAAGVGPADEVGDACRAGLLLGIAHPHDPMDTLIERVHAALARAPQLAHLAASAPLQATVTAVAAAVSSGLAGATWEQRVAFAAWAADAGAAGGSYRPGPLLSARITWACALASRTDTDPLDVLALLVGNSGLPQECVPAGVALAAVSPDVRAAQASAYALGGAADVITALAGCLAAAGDPRPASADLRADRSAEVTGAGLVEGCPWTRLAAHLLSHRAP